MEFKVGDEIEYELSKRGFPRWDFGTDRGGSGEWFRGKVVSIGPQDLVTAHPEKESHWLWPRPDHERDLYAQPGYLRKVKEPGVVEVETKFNPLDRFLDLEL